MKNSQTITKEDELKLYKFLLFYKLITTKTEKNYDIDKVNNK